MRVPAMKLCIKGCVILASMLGGFVPPIFAQSSCETCNTMPSGLQEYTTMVDILLALFPSEPYLIAGTGTVNFGGKVAQSAALHMATFQNILPPHPSYDVYTLQRMVYNDDALQRDWEVLLETQEKIIDRTITLVNTDNHLREISVTDLNIIDTELKKLKYIQLKKNEDGVYELQSDKASYEILARLLRQLQVLYEEMHADGWYHYELYSVGEGLERSDDPDIEQAIVDMEHEHLLRVSTLIGKKLNSVFGKSIYTMANNVELMQYLEFPQSTNLFLAYIRDIQQSYECSVGLALNECNAAWQDVRKETAFVFKERIVKDSSRAKDTFLTAWSRLKGVFKRGSTADGAASRQREKALLNSYRGTDFGGKNSFWQFARVETAYDPTPIWLETLWKKINSTQKAKSNTLSQGSTSGKSPLQVSVRKDPTAISPSQKDAERYPRKQDKEEVIQELGIGEQMLEYQKEVTRFFGGLQKDETTDLKAASLKRTIFSVLDLQEDIQAASVFTDVKRTTQKFPLLSAAVHANIKLLGKKNPVNESEGGWYYAMSKVCELQCTNLEGKICEHFGN